MKYNLRGKVRACPLKPSDPLGVDLLADPIVGHLEVHRTILSEPLVLGPWVLPHQNILRLQVSIDEASGVQIVESLSNLRR